MVQRLSSHVGELRLAGTSTKHTPIFHPFAIAQDRLPPSRGKKVLIEEGFSPPNSLSSPRIVVGDPETKIWIPNKGIWE